MAGLSLEGRETKVLAVIERLSRGNLDEIKFLGVYWEENRDALIDIGVRGAKKKLRTALNEFRDSKIEQ